MVTAAVDKKSEPEGKPEAADADQRNAPEAAPFSFRGYRQKKRKKEKQQNQQNDGFPGHGPDLQFAHQVAEDGFFQIIHGGDKLVVAETHFSEDRLGRGIDEDRCVLPGHQFIYGEEGACSGNRHTPEKPVDPRLLSDPLDE